MLKHSVLWRYIDQCYVFFSMSTTRYCHSCRQLDLLLSLVIRFQYTWYHIYMFKHLNRSSLLIKLRFCITCIFYRYASPFDVNNPRLILIIGRKREYVENATIIVYDCIDNEVIRQRDIVSQIFFLSVLTGLLKKFRYIDWRCPSVC